MQLIKKTMIVLFLLLTIFSLAFAQKGQPQAEQSREAACRRVPCRPAKTIKLKIGKKEIAEFDFPKGPFVAEGYVNILSGEEINVEFEEGENALSNARYVEKISAPGKTIIFKLEQTDEGAVLSVKNPFAKNILYDCLIQHYKAQGLEKTSILPVQSNLLGFEMWPYPITQVVINNVRFAPSK